MRRRDFLLDGLRQTVGIASGLILPGGTVWAVPQPVSDTPTKRTRTIRVWSEETAPASVYPKDIRGAVADDLSKLRGYTISTATLSDPEQGLSQAELDSTDVLIWCGRHKHDDVSDAAVERIVRRVTEGGMGIVFLHSTMASKPFRALLHSSGDLRELVATDRPQIVSVTEAKHPIARGVRGFTVAKEALLEAPLPTKKPGEIVFEARNEPAGTATPLGQCWTVGKGRIFYLHLGREEASNLLLPEVRRILRNAALWTADDEVGIWEDCDPTAANARATKEPPLALILRDVGYGGTDITKPGEIKKTFTFVRASPGPVKTYPIASYGLIKDLTAGWYAAKSDINASEPERKTLWVVEAKYNKQDKPPLVAGAVTEFDPGDKPFGLWVSTAGFAAPPEFVDTDDTRNAAIRRFGGKPIHKARVYAAVRTDFTPVPNAYIIGWEYSTNDDFQDIVTIVENVRPASAAG